MDQPDSRPAPPMLPPEPLVGPLACAFYLPLQSGAEDPILPSSEVQQERSWNEESYWSMSLED